VSRATPRPGAPSTTATSPDVERLVASLGIIDAEADDICQEIFVIIYRNLARFRGEARLSTWIYRLATREAIRFARRRRLLRGLADLFARDRGPQLPQDCRRARPGGATTCASSSSGSRPSGGSRSCSTRSRACP
jgi:DNA-directed RNA polymerase specialized sigma24 family protein